MRLQKHFNKKSNNGKDYYKWELVIPPEIIEKSGFKEGDELEASSKKEEIRLRKKIK
jgi:hypothetical protein